MVYFHQQSSHEPSPKSLKVKKVFEVVLLGLTTWGCGQAVDHGGRELKKLCVAPVLSSAIWGGRGAFQVTGREPDQHRVTLVLRTDSLERRAEELGRDRMGWRPAVLGRAVV
ncbi:hypothetical protein NDU88_003677 [Pleurodeles waltl]|uniref:Uncharacterized protein n=1 Tax=Pleurodeles waltl TaxID=8319 RepID=A0AAV7RJ95_PLEWA|nr:hypothetical protein NDU88_003677 [Pleurodeles waltl]